MRIQVEDSEKSHKIGLLFIIVNFNENCRIKMTDQNQNSCVSSESTDEEAEQPLGSISSPSVVKFAYKEFVVTGSKWLAKCNTCGIVITENRGVTSGYTK